MEKLATLEFGNLCRLIENNDDLRTKLREHVESITIDGIAEEIGVLAKNGGLDTWQISFCGDCYVTLGDPLVFIDNVSEYEKAFWMPISVREVIDRYNDYVYEFDCGTNVDVAKDFALRILDAFKMIFFSEIEFVNEAFTYFDSSFQEIVSDFADIVFNDYYVEGNSVLHIEKVCEID